MCGLQELSRSGRQDLNLRPSGPPPLNSGRRPLCAVAVVKSEVRPVAVGVGGESRERGRGVAHSPMKRPGLVLPS